MVDFIKAAEFLVSLSGDEISPRRVNKDERWHRYFLRLAHEASLMSKDPSTRVGAVLVKPDRSIISMGYNGFARGVAETPSRLSDRKIKLALTIHAEMNAILLAAANGIATSWSTLYFTWADVATDTVYGGPPCPRCCVELAQAGIKNIVGFRAERPERWLEDESISRLVLREAEITLYELEP